MMMSTPRKSEPTMRAACSASRRIAAQIESVTVSVMVWFPCEPRVSLVSDTAP